MNPPQTIFLHARGLRDPAERAAYLDSACSGDAELRARLEALLADSSAADAYFEDSETQESPAPRPPMPLATTELLPEQIGPYRILERLGHGGMGEVYRAEQRVPIRREVALKLIKLGMDTKQVVARFEAERQAMALMDHPHIAKVYGADADEKGRPYFAMEYVKGIPITEYADINHLTVKERLELFQQVCHAIQHAHQKGVIHRDIKPSNILVSTQDGRPHAKVIDFGIAKATAQQLTDKTLFTLHDQFIGTPQYMSPEQATGSLDIDTRSDVYSLGVLLYELLTGQTPFDSAKLKKAALHEVARILREEEPPKPSTRLGTLASLAGGKSPTSQQPAPPTALATLAKARSMDAQQLVKEVRGELDWLVMKAMDKDRARRYATPNDVAEDVGRYLSGQAVQAAPPTFRYRTGKFVRRYRVAVATGVALLALVTGSLVLVTSQMLRANEAKKEAIEQRRQAGRERDQAVLANQRADKEYQNATAAKAEAESSLVFQKAATARLLTQTQDYPAALEAIRALPDDDRHRMQRHWAAWEWCRSTREFSRLDVMPSLPDGIEKVSARSRLATFMSSEFDMTARKFRILFSGDRSLDLDLPTLPPSVRRKTVGSGEPRSPYRILDAMALVDERLSSGRNRPGGNVWSYGERKSRLVVDCSMDEQAKSFTFNYPAGVVALVCDRAGGRVAVVLTSGVLEVLQLAESGLERILSLDTGSEPSQITTVAFEPGADVIHLLSGELLLRSFHVAKEAPDLRKSSGSNVHKATIRRLAESGDGTLVATIGYDHHVKIWDASSLAVVRDLSPKELHIKVGRTSLTGSVTFLGKSRGFACCNFYGPSWVASDLDGKLSRVPLAGAMVVGSTNDGRRLFMPNDGKIASYDLATGATERIADLDSERTVYAMAFSGNGKWMAWVDSGREAGAEQGSIYLHSLETGANRSLTTGFGSLRDVDFSPDDDTIAVCSRDGTASLVSMTDGRILFRLPVCPGVAHSNIVSSIRFHPVLPVVVTASHDSRVIFWSTETGQQLASLNVDPAKEKSYFNGYLKQAVFSRDGKALYLCVGDESLGQLFAIDLTFWDQSIGALLTGSENNE